MTPAINIHRSPLCGRNFEYYSEDPFLTGKMAAAMVKGIQSQHVGATVKHFALNNKDTNCRNSDSRVSERAAREIYLKAFEITVIDANPWSVMSSYNIINGQRASENRELLEDILRGEWGWDGMVTTDWWTYGEHYKETKAGNDVKMGLGYPERLMKAKESGLISREEMNVCARRILEKHGHDDFYTVSIEPGIKHIIGFCDAALKNLENPRKSSTKPFLSIR